MVESDPVLLGGETVLSAAGASPFAVRLLVRALLRLVLFVLLLLLLLLLRLGGGAVLPVVAGRVFGREAAGAVAARMALLVDVGEVAVEFRDGAVAYGAMLADAVLLGLVQSQGGAGAEDRWTVAAGVALTVLGSLVPLQTVRGRQTRAAQVAGEAARVVRLDVRSVRPVSLARRRRERGREDALQVAWEGEIAATAVARTVLSRLRRGLGFVVVLGRPGPWTGGARISSAPAGSDGTNLGRRVRRPHGSDIVSTSLVGSDATVFVRLTRGYSDGGCNSGRDASDDGGGPMLRPPEGPTERVPLGGYGAGCVCTARLVSCGSRFGSLLA